MKTKEWYERDEWKGWSEISTTCDCEGNDCYGDCWESNLYYFASTTETLFTKNDKSAWEVIGLPLWNRGVDGIFDAETPKELLRGITVNGEFTFRWKVDESTLLCWIAHHDKPTGGHYSVGIAK